MNTEQEQRVLCDFWFHLSSKGVRSGCPVVRRLNYPCQNGENQQMEIETGERHLDVLHGVPCRVVVLEPKQAASGVPRAQAGLDEGLQGRQGGLGVGAHQLLHALRSLPGLP